MDIAKIILGLTISKNNIIHEYHRYLLRHEISIIFDQDPLIFLFFYLVLIHLTYLLNYRLLL